MGISYAGQKIQPSPFITKKKTYITSSDGTILGATFNFSLEGTLLPSKGSPTSSGTFWIASGYCPDENLPDDTYWMQSLIRKQEALRQLFSNEGSGFRIDGFDGYNYLSCNPRIKSIAFPAGNPISWVNQCKYSIELEADKVYLFDANHTDNTLIEDTGIISGFLIDQAEENWSIDSVDENLPLFKLSHQINAKGKRFYGLDGNLSQRPWQNARDWVVSRLGINTDRVYCSGVLNLSNFSGYNYLRTQQQNDLGGTFAVTETWVICNIPSGYRAHEDYDINVRTDEAGLTTVGVQGKIQGLEVRDNTTRGAITQRKFYNASGYYWQVQPNFLSRAQNIAGLTLHPTPISITVGHNELTGVISYNYEYNNRASASLSGARSEKISISFQYASDAFAELSVLGRAAGPVFQALGTVTSSQKTVTLEAVMAAKSQANPSPSMPNADSIVDAYAPSGPTWVNVTTNTVSWDEATGRIVRTKGWKFGS